ncbi:MAG TPA: MFS transporter, partial [Deltaproteobacteria bacterium]|nr:MFS transporter [Deltaproteobacteria bacterium]
MKIAGNRTVILIVASLSSFLTPFMGSSVSVALPSIGKAFSLDALTLGWISTSYLIASSVFLLPLGRAADIYGRKRIFIWGIALYTVSSILIVLSPLASILITFRVLQGLGSSMVFGTGTAILIEAYPPEERGRVLGINVAATYLGLSLGPFLGGILTGSFGWESVFLSVVPIGLAVLILALKGIDERGRGEGPGGFDMAGSLIYSVSLIGVMYGFSKIPGQIGFTLTFAGAAGLLL